MVSGAERSLLDLLHALPPEIEPLLASPPGPLRAAVAAAGWHHIELPQMTASLRMHPVHTARGIGALVSSALRLARVAQRLEIDLVHANTIQAGVAAGLARRFGAPPVIAHVRDCLPRTFAARAVQRWIATSADAVIANSTYTAECFGRGKVDVIPPAIDVDAFEPDAAPRERVRRELGIADGDPVLTIVAQITPWKGQAEAIEMLEGVRLRFPTAHLLIVGEPKFQFAATRYDNAAYLEELKDRIRASGLDGAVHFTGEREDIQNILAATDVLLAPSWEEPFGRSIVEASAMALPVVATSIGGPSEIIEDGVNGVLLPPREPDRWVPVLVDLLEDPRRRSEMGERARENADQYSRARQVRQVIDVYRSTLLRAQPPGGVAIAQRLGRFR
jgi:glycosyltransferase involved in cell wall biosynthesis